MTKGTVTWAFGTASPAPVAPTRVDQYPTLACFGCYLEYQPHAWRVVGGKGLHDSEADALVWCVGVAPGRV